VGDLWPRVHLPLFSIVKHQPDSERNGEQIPALSPLPTTWPTRRCLVNGSLRPVLCLAGQINIPLSLTLPTSGTVVFGYSPGPRAGLWRGEVPLADSLAGLFTVDATGSGDVVALNQDNTQNSPSNPIPRGQVIQIYAYRQGPVSNPPPDGNRQYRPGSTGANPAGDYRSAFDARFHIQYSGLAPDLVGLWQIDVQIPMTATNGKRGADSGPHGQYSQQNNPGRSHQVATTISIK